MKIDISKISKSMKKLKHKNLDLFIALQKKINQLAELNQNDIGGLKNLMHDMSDFKRVHIGSFVLTFRVKDDVIIFDDFDHHDKIYKK